MALIPGALTTVAQVKSHIGIDAADISKDSLIEWLINGVSDFLAKLCKRTFQKTTYALKLDGNGTTKLFLPHYPVTSITSIKIDGNLIPATEYKIYNDSGIVHRDSGWPTGEQNIEVAFQAGWTVPKDVSRDLPYDLEMVCVKLIGKVYEKRLAEGVKNSSAGSLSVNWQDEMDEEVSSIIELYKRHRV